LAVNLHAYCYSNCATRDDKNIQVFLAALILLDESLWRLDETPQNNMSSLLSRVITNLLGKLADSKPKVVEGSSLLLLSIASSSSMDNASFVKTATKRIRSKDSNSRTLRARLHFLENLAAEFGEDVAWKRVLAFSKGHKAFAHKDGGTRDAAKSLTVSLMMVSSSK
jgi:hypothetical protein